MASVNSNEYIKSQCALNYSYFLQHKTELCAKYPNSYVVINRCRVLGAHTTFDEAHSAAVSSGSAGFIIQKCIEESPAVIQREGVFSV